MKRDSEARFREALHELGLSEILFAYKPPDDARNRKPCDYIVWLADEQLVRSTWVEVKDSDAMAVWNTKELTAAQRLGISTAWRLGIPYWLALWWRRRGRWTLTRIDRYLHDQELRYPGGEAGSLTYVLASSRFGVDCEQAHLVGTLRAALEGDVP